MNQVGGIDLLDLQQGMIGLAPAVGGSLAETASVSLESQNLSTPAAMEIHHHQTQSKSTAMVTWQAADDAMRHTWKGPIEATEYEACGIAALIVRESNGLAIIHRSAKGTGFDFWLGETGSTESGASLFQEGMRMRSTGTLPALGVGVESSKPQSHVGES